MEITKNEFEIEIKDWEYEKDPPNWDDERRWHWWGIKKMEINE